MREPANDAYPNVVNIWKVYAPEFKFAAKVKESILFGYIWIGIIYLEFIFDIRLIERTLELEICDTFTVIVFDPEVI